MSLDFNNFVEKVRTIMLRFISFGSGSSGNCYYIYTDTDSLMIDVGIGIRTLKKHLKNYGIKLTDIRHLLITHDHADHVKSIGSLSTDMTLPVYSTSKVHEGINNNLSVRKKVNPSNVKFVEKNTTTKIGEFVVTPFGVPHDSLDNVGYKIECEGVVFVLMTDKKMAFDLLQNNDIAVKILVGYPGTGKDYLMLLHALDLIQKGIMDKIIFIRNLVPFKDAPEIGYLAGDLQQKISWGLGPLSGILGEEGLNQYIDEGIIEAVNLGFIRGCSWDKTIIYVSEGQNITGGGYKLLISRCGQGSQLWVNGDILQTDSKEFEKNNGLLRLSNSLKNNPLTGTVKLIKTERSPVAELAKVI